MPLKSYDRDDWRASVNNGQIPRNRLAKIKPNQFDYDLGGPGLMHPEAAAAMSAMLKAAKEDGCNFRVKYSYRTLAKQQEKWNDYLNGGNLAAGPGTSNHGWAVSGDLTDIGEVDIYWLRRNAASYGFINDVPGEIWHWTYYGGFKAGEEENVSLDKYIEGQDKYIERYKAQDKDPGVAPRDRDKHFKKGWSHARAALNNPKGK